MQPYQIYIKLMIPSFNISINRTSTFNGFRLLFLIGIVFLHSGCSFIGKGGEIVSFFFVISGFFYKDRNNDTWFCYFFHRAKQIFPFYWTLLIIQKCLLAINWHSIAVFKGFLQIDFIAHFLLLQSFVPFKDDEPAFAIEYLGAAWFLSSLMFSYLIAPLFYKTLIKNRSKLYLHSLLLVFALSYIAMQFSFWGEYNTWFHYFSPIVRFFEYAMGVILAAFLRNETDQKKISESIAIVGVTVYLIILHFRVLDCYSTFAHLFICYFLFCYKSVTIQFAFGNSLVQKLSSFGLYIYLVHYLYLVETESYYDGNYLTAIKALLVSIIVGVIWNIGINSLSLKVHPK